MREPFVRRRLCRPVVLAGVALLNASCTLVSPGCRNRDVKGNIEQEARASIDLWLATTHQTVLPTSTPLQLVEPVEVSQKDPARACSAKIVVGSGDKLVSVPIDYEVIAGDDGQAFYRWDKEEFGKTFIGTRLFSLLPQIARQPATSADTPNDRIDQTPDTTQRVDGSSPSSRSAARQTSAASDVSAKTERWRDNVIATINAQATNFKVEGSGAVRISFFVSSFGEISEVKVVESSGNAKLDATAVQMAEKAGRVRAPPSRQATSLSMKLSFL